MNKKQTIFRVHKEPGDYFQMHKNIVNNPEISYKAKGIMAYLLSKPNDWTVYFSDIVKRSTEGKAAVLSGVQELEQAGYIERVQKKGEDGKFLPVEWHVYEQPFTANRFSGNGKPATGKSDTTNNNSIKNKRSKLRETSPDFSDPDQFKKNIKLPEIALYREVTGRIPGMPQMPIIYRTIQENNLTKEDILPFWEVWVTRGYRTANLSWLTEWAVSGEIPTFGSAATKNEPKPNGHSVPDDPEAYAAEKKRDAQRRLQAALAKKKEAQNA